MLTADEIGRALSGSIRLLNRDEKGLGAFEVSEQAFWRSFAAVILTAPAFVTALAFDRVRLGLPLDDGLFADPWIVLRELFAAGLGWIAPPLLMIAVVRRLGLGDRYFGYVIAYNWSAVITATIFALPTALFVLGVATYELSVLYACAFGIIVLQYRWFLAKSALGVSGGIAALVVVADVALTGIVGTVVAVIA